MKNLIVISLLLVFGCKDALEKKGETINKEFEKKMELHKEMDDEKNMALIIRAKMEPGLDTVYKIQDTNIYEATKYYHKLKTRAIDKLMLDVK